MQKISRTNPIAFRPGRYLEFIEGALRSRQYPGVTELVHTALRCLLTDPLTQPTRERLETLARFLGMSTDAAAAALLDRYAAELHSAKTTRHRAP